MSDQLPLAGASAQVNRVVLTYIDHFRSTPTSGHFQKAVVMSQKVPTCDIEGVRVDRSRVPVFRHDKPLSAG
jgi:hypothetical protein